MDNMALLLREIKNQWQTKHTHVDIMHNEAAYVGPRGLCRWGRQTLSEGVLMMGITPCQGRELGKALLGVGWEYGWRRMGCDCRPLYLLLAL